MEYRSDKNEERKDKNLPPTYFCELLPHNPTFGHP